MSRRPVFPAGVALHLPDPRPTPLAAIRRVAVRLAVEHLLLNEEQAAGHASEVLAVARRFTAFLKAGDRSYGNVMLRAEMLERASGKNGAAARVKSAARLLVFVEKGR